MAHRYGEPVQVTLTQPDQLPSSFTWRGWRYWVEVIGMWHLGHLTDRWWDPARHADRHYYRVMTADHQVFELYHDTVSGVWILDIVHD